MMASLSAGSNFNNVNSNGNNNREENEYEEDSFDEDSEEEEEEEEEGGRALSETGTYVLDKEEEEKQKVKKMMMVIKVTTCERAGREGRGLLGRGKVGQRSEPKAFGEGIIVIGGDLDQWKVSVECQLVLHRGSC